MGYESEQAFNRAFKREFGVPPARWRRRDERAAGTLSGMASKLREELTRERRSYRPRPRPNEELVLARWTSTPKAKPKAVAQELAIFHLCGGVPSLLGRTRGPVATLGSPVADADAQRVSVPIATDPDKGELKIHYVYGAAQLDQPPWVRAGSSLATEASSDRA